MFAELYEETAFMNTFVMLVLLQLRFFAPLRKDIMVALLHNCVGAQFQPLLSHRCGIGICQKPSDLKIPESNLTNLVKHIHQNAITYLTYLVPNIMKLDNKQAPVPPPQSK